MTTASLAGYPYRVYAADATPGAAAAVAIASPLSVRIWRPTATAPLPPGPRAAAHAVWAAFHALRLFAHRDYGAVLVDDGGRVVHRSFVFPRYPRFPFMGADDVQVGDTWTAPSHRGRGLASAAIAAARVGFAAPGRRVWYVTAESNVASIRAAERAGLRLAGGAHRRPRLGLGVLGFYALTPTTSTVGRDGVGASPSIPSWPTPL